MSIDDGDGIWICYGDVIWLQTNKGPVLLMGCVNGGVAATSTTLVHEPQV